MMDRLQRPSDWERVSRREWAIFGLVQQLCVITLLVVLYVLVCVRMPANFTMREVVQYALAIVTGVQLALLYCRLRKLRGGE